MKSNMNAIWVSSWTRPFPSRRNILSLNEPFSTSKTSADSPPLSNSVAETLIHAFITSPLDYCNGALFGVSSKVSDRLQYTDSHPTMAAHCPHPPAPPLAPSQVPYHVQTSTSHIQIPPCPRPPVSLWSPLPSLHPGPCIPLTQGCSPSPSPGDGPLGTGLLVWQPPLSGTLSLQIFVMSQPWKGTL